MKPSSPYGGYSSGAISEAQWAPESMFSKWRLPKTPSILLSVGKAPLENSKDVMDETLFSEGQIDSNEEEDDFEDDDDFEDGYGDDDLNGFNEYEY